MATALVSCQIHPDIKNELTNQLQQIADSSSSRVGIAVITDRGDTITINNDDQYPLMSVFKLHQAIATCHFMGQNGIALDSVVTISRSELNPTTWSPMLKEHTADTICVNFHHLMSYTLEQSDNNASNYLFDHLISVEATDSIICQLIPRSEFSLSHTEAEMQQNHALAFENYSTPLGAARLISEFYADTTLLLPAYKESIRQSLEQCKTGTDRIVAPLIDKPEVTVGHKTGSGYRDKGLLVAHNDVGYIQLPDGRHYTLAILIKNFPGTEAEASALMARISALTYTTLSAR